MNQVNFKQWFDAGYHDLLPVVPPDAHTSPKSHVAKGKGKSPGIRQQSGLWGGFMGWNTHKTTIQDIADWQGMGASVGLRFGDAWLLDLDVYDSERAEEIEAAAIEMLGPAPMRVGQWPKRALLYRNDGTLKPQKLRFAGKQGEVNIIEIPPQAVIQGTHAKTGKPYEWRRKPVAFDALTMVSADKLSAFMRAMKAKLPSATTIEGGSDNDVNQDTLRGNVDIIAEIMNRLPNRSSMRWDDMIKMGYAVKAALPDNPDLAFDLWDGWCSRWEDEGYDHEVAAVRWGSFKGPFRVGATWLYELGNKLIGETEHFDARALLWADDLDTTEPNPFSEAENSRNDSTGPEPIKWVRPSEWKGLTPPPREWEVVNWIPKGEVTLLYGDGGIGKTLVIHQYATAAAAGLAWLGQETRQARVMCFFCEDSEEELLRRQIDINKSMMIGFDDIDDRLRIASRKYMDNLFILWDRNTGAMKRQVVWEQLLQDAKAFGAEVLVVDTIADTYGGSEIDRGQVNAFVKSCLGRLAQELRGSVIALGHPSMAGKASGSGTSGSTAWSNAARSRLFLRYPKGVEKGNIREMEGMKLNYGPKGSLLKLRWDQGAFAVLASSMPPANGGEAGKKEVLPGDTVVGAAGFGLAAGSVDGAALDAVVTALRCCDGVVMNMKPNSPHYAPKVLRSREPDILEAFNGVEIETALRLLEREGALFAVEVGRSNNRHVQYGLSVRDTLSGFSGIFA